jgi:hypothetical protein
MRCSQMTALGAISIVFALGAVSAGVAQGQTFEGYDCIDDCSGHAAGYRWAEMNGLIDPNECPAGNSQSFYEGCLVHRFRGPNHIRRHGRACRSRCGRRDDD